MIKTNPYIPVRQKIITQKKLTISLEKFTKNFTFLTRIKNYVIN